MFKLALVAAAVTATGVTAYAVHTPATASTAVPHVAIAPAAPVTAAPTPAAVQPSRAVPPRSPVLTAGAPADPALVEAPAGPDIDHATIERVGLYRGPARGPADAPVTIVVFSDLLCQFCGESLGSLDQLWDEFPGKLRVVVKQFPVHPEAFAPAEASLAADAQGKFWELEDLMYANQDDLSHDKLIALAERAGLDVAAFRTALDRHTFAAGVDADFATARQLEVNATPTFLINGKRITGNLPIKTLRAAIVEALATL
jgi:protein-disulfide isomerase